MIQVLIVDDQQEIVRGICSGVDWAEIPQISRVFQASSSEAAKAIMQSDKIDLLVTDIEMPGENGLELVSWVNENCPHVKCILLTAHAKFTYAQDAVRLQCIDYILQPVQYTVLQNSIEKAVMLIEKEKETLAGIHIGSYWNAHRIELERKTWLDYLLHPQLETKEFLMQMESQDIELPVSGLYFALLVYVPLRQVRLEEWSDQTTLKSVCEKLQPYIDSFVSYSCQFQQDENRCAFVATATVTEDAVFERLQAFCNLYTSNYDIPLSMYYCCSDTIDQLPVRYRETEQQFQETLIPVSGVYRPGKEENDALGVLPSTHSWCDCFINKTTQFIWDSIQGCIRRNVEKGTMNQRTLSALQQAFLFSFQQSLQKRALSFSQLMTDQELIRGLALSLHSVSEFNKFVDLILEKNRTLSDTNIEEGENAIAMAQAYIAEHLSVSDLARYKIAKAAHISESYLSHLFTKEVGLSIKDYINLERLKLAKSLLADTSIPITLVATKSGYNSASYFTSIFKKATGLTPVEYRRQHQRTKLDVQP